MRGCGDEGMRNGRRRAILSAVAVRLLAPWTIVPADSKTHRNLMIGTVVKQSLEALKLRYPPGDPALANIKVI